MFRVVRTSMSTIMLVRQTVARIVDRMAMRVVIIKFAKNTIMLFSVEHVKHTGM